MAGWYWTWDGWPVGDNHQLTAFEPVCFYHSHDIVAWLQVAWESGEDVQRLWQAVQDLLDYPHVWVRKASARLLGLILASPSIGEAPACA